MSASQSAASPAPIAIIGIACRYPGGANNPDSFWQMLRNGTDSVTEVPLSRWDAAPIYDPDPRVPNKTNTRWGGFLDHIDQFDPQFFGIAPREVATMDPQQRLLLEVTWEALEDAGRIPEDLRGSKTGVFIGIGTHDYSIMLWQQPVNDPYATTGTGNCIAANRISYMFDLKGPSLAVDTACSSSLVAMHLACQSLWSGESKLALAGGVNVLILPTVTAGFSKGGFMSGEGRCKSFDASADGYVRSEGAGIVVLKPLKQALADGDDIYAVIRGSAVNQDGFSKGMAAPNPQAQTAVLREAYQLANINPANVHYIEAHGTGTKLGDPIEAQALGAVLAEERSHTNPCLIGSVKTNIGHTETAAGVAGIIKAALILKHREIPPSLHFNNPNPNIDFDQLKLKVQANLTTLTNTQATYVGVNSFGFGGTNAHIVLSDLKDFNLEESDLEKSNLEKQQAQDSPQTTAPTSTQILTLSAKSQSALKALAKDYTTLLKKQPNIDLSALCTAANTKRSQFTHRLACVTSTTERLTEQLQAYLNDIENTTPEDIIGVFSHQNRNKEQNIAFLCTGQGSQFVGMGRELYKTQPIFRNIIKRCTEILQQEYNIDLLGILFDDANPTAIHQTIHTQPILFAFEYALAKLWQSWGIQPSVVLGHSLGEYVAACIAGIFSPKDALKLVAARGRLMQALPAGGSMISVLADTQTCESVMRPFSNDVSIAAVNGPQSTVISGKKNAIEQIFQQLEQQNIKCKFLKVSHAFHSAMMEPMLEDFCKVAESVTYQAPQIPMISMLTGQLAIEEIATADYWVRHVRSPVQFLSAIHTLAEQNTQTFLEIGPKPILLGMARACLSDSKIKGKYDADNIQWLASLRPSQTNKTSMLTSLAQLYTQTNTKIDWKSIATTSSSAKISLPTYPFQRQRYWWEEASIPSMEPKSSAKKASVSPVPIPKEPGKNSPKQQKRKLSLLGNPLPLAGATEQRFQTELTPQNLGYLTDHKVLQQVVLPGAAYIEIAIAAAHNATKPNTALNPKRPISLSQVTIEKPLILSQSHILQTVLTPTEDQSLTVQIFSAIANPTQPDHPEFTRHATATARITPQASALNITLSDIQLSLLPHPINVQEYYEVLSTQGLNYGPSFRRLQQLWHTNNQALSQISWHDHNQDSNQDNNHHLHPALLDACFQTIGAAIKTDPAVGTYLPVGLDQIDFYAPLTQSGWCHVQLQLNDQNNSTKSNGNRDNSTPTKQLKADLSIWDDKGNIAAQITGMTLQHISQPSLQQLFGAASNQPASQTPSQTEQSIQASSKDWLYTLDWQPKPNPKTTTNPQTAWIIFTDTPSISQPIQTALEAKEEQTFVYTLSTATPNSFQQIFSDLTLTLIEQQSGNLSCRILYLCSANNQTASSPITSQETICGNLLQLVQALTQFPALQARLWVVTQSTQILQSSTAPSSATTQAALQLKQTPLWGLTRTLRLEQPDLQCTCIDLDSPASTSGTNTTINPQTITHLIDDLQHPDQETQIAYRNNNRFVARLTPYTNNSAIPLPATDAFRLGLSSYGVLDHLTLMPAARQAPGAGEIEIQVRAAGLNFRDVLNALGMLQSVLEEMGFSSPELVPFGGECAGTVTAVGPGVESFKVGDTVIAAQAVGSLRQFITLNAEFVVPKPTGMSFAEAATVPTTFLTAYYGLVHCAKLKKGDRILIHSAAGGVGQAAVQIAQHIGAEIFATASQPKWTFLESLGIAHIMNSRTLDFAAQTLAATEGKGVDVIFNSLNGDFIDKSIEVLTEGGRFIEIGKIGIWEKEKMQTTRPDVQYFPFDLLKVSQKTPQLIQQMLSHIMAQFSNQTLQPLHKTVFPIQQAPNAFRYMAQAKHIGKVVLTLPAIAPKQSLIDSSATYLITGGLGALGLQLAQWLAKQGAKNLLLIGRSKPSKTAQQIIKTLKNNNVSVKTAQVDIANLNTLKTVLSPYLPKEPTISDPSAANRVFPHPIKGIFHLAGTLKDGLLTNQSWDNFATVMQPKIAGAWHLHTLSQQLNLDHFVCFSSMVSLMGSLGQSNYAAANAFLDSLASYRQSLGLPALTLNWGPWAEVGMVAQLDERNQKRMSDQGLTPIAINTGLQCLSEMMNQPQAQVGIIPIDWATFNASASGQASGAKSSFFECIYLEHIQPTATKNQTIKPSGIIQALASVTKNERPTRLATYLQTQLARVMGFNDPSTINPNEQFGDLGMDSLMAVEFSNRLQTNLNHPIPQTLAFDYPTVNALAMHLATEIVLPNISEISTATTKTATKTKSKEEHSSEQKQPSTETETDLSAESLSPADSPIELNKTNRTGKMPILQDSSNPPSPTPPSPTPPLPTPPEHYQFAKTTDYRRLRQDLDRVETLGNPFFTLHDGTAKDTTTINGRSLVNYASYNYLGLSGDPRINQAAQAAIAQYGTSVSASRVVSGERPVHRQLEKSLANFLQTPDCITYIGGHATNVTTIGHLFQAKDLIFYDALSHNSIREGCNLSGATAIEFPHNDWQALDQLLHQHRSHYEKVLIAIEGVYSTDGDIAPLPEFVNIKTAHKTFLLVDEAHSIGVLGNTGRGVGEYFNIARDSVDLWMGTFSKSFASCGGYIAGCSELIEYLKYTAPGFVFSVGMAPANAAAALAALQVIEQEPNRVAQVQAKSKQFLTLAKERGLNTGTSHNSPVIPIIVGEPYKAVKLSQTLFQQSINVQPMVYPSVPYDAARLRFFLSSLHTEEQIQKTVQVLADELMILNVAEA